MPSTSMEDNDLDTEILLASLASLLEPDVTDTATLLTTLVECNGNVEAAAQALQASSSTSKSTPNSSAVLEPGKKRKRTAEDLDVWLSSTTSKSKPDSRKKKPVSESKVTNLPSNVKTTKKPSSTGANESLKPANLMSVLRAPPAAKPTITKHLPLTLSNPQMVAEHTPCTLHYNILPPELACELFYTMYDAAQGWSRNKWWLFDRVVESPHKTSFFSRIDRVDASNKNMQEEAQFWYNGRRTDTPYPFPEEMEAACQYIEKVVNEEMRKRTRYPLEWAGSPETDGLIWHANVAASNCYEGSKEGVGFHSDQLTYLGPYATIASLSLGTTRTFRLREVIPASEKDSRHARTYNTPLPHNSLIIMHASTQERFKHSIPLVPTIDVFRPPFPRRRFPSVLPQTEGTSITTDHDQTEVNSNSTKAMPSTAGEREEIQPYNCRINITFRFYRPDYAASTTPRCKCGVPCILRPDMKGRVDRQEERHSGASNTDDGYRIKYWWTCYAGAQNDGKGCGMWKVMDAKAEGRGPFVGESV